MTTAHGNPILRHIHRMVCGPDHEGLDRELLKRYLKEADASAKMVKHHGPIVLGVRPLTRRKGTDDGKSARAITGQRVVVEWTVLHGMAGWAGA